MRRDRGGQYLALALLLALLVLLVLAARAHHRATARIIAAADRCGALTLRGLPCRNPVRGSARCWRHRPAFAPRVAVLDRT